MGRGLNQTDAVCVTPTYCLPGLGLALTACLLCADPSLPRPSISLSPTGVIAPGADVTIRCQGQHRYVRFFLHKAGDLNPQRHMDPAGDGAEFRIPTVGRQHGGSYSCSYRLRSEPFVSSQPSDPVQLVVAGERPSSTFSLPARPSWGLCTDGPLRARLCPGPSRGDARRRGAVSPLFNSCLLLKAGREFVKPTIWVSPSRVVALGESVTIRCEGRYPGMEFFLRKAGHPNPQVQTVPDGTVAEFPIASVSREDGGSYTCDYRSITDQSRSSYLSDPVEIIVAGEGYPKPSISLSPSGGVSLGGAVTVRCRGQHRGVFFLHKAADLNPQRHMDPAGDGAEFRIPTVGRHGGNYSCSYRLQSQPFISSQPSNPVELVVGGEGPGSTSPLPAGPSKLRHPNGMLRARLCPESSVPPPWPRGAVGSESPPALRPQQVARVLPSWGCRGGPDAKASPVPTMVLL
uniref:Ig-like domain-containing protein n=1 Tax=Chrysemys picta bellii TaxID=8478 RepID=A0A8C3HU33_CHRPI